MQIGLDGWLVDIEILYCSMDATLGFGSFYIVFI